MTNDKIYILYIIYVRDKIQGKKPLKEHLFTCFQIQKNECLGHSGFICSTHLFKNALNFRFLMWSDFIGLNSTNSLFKILSHEKPKVEDNFEQWVVRYCPKRWKWITMAENRKSCNFHYRQVSSHSVLFFFQSKCYKSLSYVWPKWPKYAKMTEVC